MSLFIARVYVWQDTRDSSNRISASEATTGRLFILNTNRITDVKELSTLVITRSSFYYSDNPASRREGLSYIECNLSAAQVVAQFDVVPASNAVTLPICPYNSPYKGNPCFPLRTPVDTTIGLWSIAYVTRYNPDPNNYVWVAYYKGSFKRMEVLVSLDVDMYPTLTSTTTEEQR
uniref:Uncharacterized protein n=1 Tax=viral metagenome TaxID=1070528 RepID=A0A6M3IJE4_9ZZZZ